MRPWSTRPGCVTRRRYADANARMGSGKAGLNSKMRGTEASCATIRETTQPNLTDLTYWATGLTPVYLDGALARTLHTPAPRAPVVVVPPRYDRPARRRPPTDSGHESILNPFSVYEKSPDLLAQELTALRGWHLKQIIRDYGLADGHDGALDSMTEPELGSLIMRRVRELHP